MQEPAGKRQGGLRELPKGVWALGFGSLFMDTSSELIHSLLPIFMASVLGASMVTIGLIEGVAEATASITRVFSGVLSDYVGRRKPLMVTGYALAALSKPVFPLANAIEWVFVARFVDRVGKGIRGAPRDALLADITPREMRGAAYGLRQALDSVGASLGPLLAALFLFWFADNIEAAMWGAAAPAFLAVVVLVVYVREPARSPTPVGTARAPLSLTQGSRLPLRFWLVVGLGALFTLTRFSEAFLVLRAQSVGLTLGLVPLVMVAMNVGYALCAYPAGAAADRMSRRGLLITGLLFLVAADGLLALAVEPAAVFGGAVLWGLHMAFTQGLLSKLVADHTPAELRGTAFGLFNLVVGVSLLLASVIAGGLWTLLGPAFTFAAGAAFAGLAALGLLLVR